jgi:kanamycin kinase
MVPTEDPPPVPADIVDVTAGGDLELVWHNDLGGLTYRWRTSAGDRYVKWVRADRGIPTSEEAARLHWAAPHATVPTVVDVGFSPAGSWLVTEGIPGRSAVDDRWLADPRRAVIAIGEGLASLHEQLPYEPCPFDWTTTRRLASALESKGDGEFDRTHWNEEHRALTDAEVLARLRDVPDPDPVVCHGDPCAPNTLMGDDGRWCGHVDFDELGRGDRWADLSVAAWSTEWNYGPGWDDLLVRAYGVTPDPERAAYFRLLWDLG